MQQIEPAKARASLKEFMWEDNNRWMADEKLDGTRYLCHLADNGKNRFTSRRISVKDGLFVEKTDNFLHLSLPPWKGLEGTVVDGEIVMPGNSKSWDVTSITGGKPEKALRYQKERGFVDYVMFDVLFYKGKDVRNEPLWLRLDILKMLYGVHGLCKNKHMRLIRNAHEGKREFYENIIESGGEGIILKNLDSKYGENQAWAKVKQEARFDVFITGYLAPEQTSTKVSGETSITKYASKGWIGSITIGQFNADGSLRDCGSVSGMSEPIREQLTNAPETNKGRVIEISAQERIPSGFFRHPRFERFRDDKDAKDCIYREEEL